MTIHRKLKLLAACLPVLVFLLPSSDAQNARPGVTVGSQGPMPEYAKFSTAQIEGGRGLFLQNCAFCHGKDAGGGESGPDLTRSKLVSSDKEGESLGAVIHNGRPEKGMPKFNLSDRTFSIWSRSSTQSRTRRSPKRAHGRAWMRQTCRPEILRQVNVTSKARGDVQNVTLRRAWAAWLLGTLGCGSNSRCCIRVT